MQTRRATAKYGEHISRLSLLAHIRQVRDGSKDFAVDA